MRTRHITHTALFAAIISIISPIMIPVGPVPITPATFIIMLTPYVLTFSEAFTGLLIYLLLGLVGVPVFSGFRGGFQVFSSPTCGFLIGYIFLMVILFLFYRIGKKKTFTTLIGMLLGTLVMYEIGILWLQFMTGLPHRAAFITVLPTIPGDIIKIVLATIVGPILRTRMFLSERGNTTERHVNENK